MSRAATCASIFSLAALAIAGCLAAIRSSGRPPGFDHAAHLKRDLACADCHEHGKSKAKAGMPKLDFCANCHDPKTDRPTITTAVADYGKARWPSAAVHGPTYADVKFDHARHAAAKVECAACHEGAATAALANPSGPMRMDACTSCHEEKGARNDCATCHRKLRKDTQPPNHEPGWLLHHGPVSRVPDRERMAERCDACHARADCDSCHTKDPPRDHTNPFRVATHGLSAAMDRSRCMSCHQADSCDRCHEVQPPRSHRPSFGDPQNRHCFSCHLPVGASGCVTCHKGTPSHGRAPPKPPAISAHGVPSTPDQCLSCHRQVSHPVTAEDCNLCHR